MAAPSPEPPPSRGAGSPACARRAAAEQGAAAEQDAAALSARAAPGVGGAPGRAPGRAPLSTRSAGRVGAARHLRTPPLLLHAACCLLAPEPSGASSVDTAGCKTFLVSPKLGASAGVLRLSQQPGEQSNRGASQTLLWLAGNCLCL